ncbi:TetR/AcrR family transcriptional regulator [Pseudorhodobacter ferrugineus]|nr:TetR/AcrR family transcriptional regulator [Pseudorhodobacter ferrugineus]
MRARKSSQDRKAEILATILDLAFEVGPAHVTTGMLAGRLGLTQPAIYKHFPNKKDIWHEITNSLCARIRENLRQGATANDPPLAMLKQLVLGHLRLVTETPALPEIIVARDPGSDLTEARQQIHAAMGEFREALRGKLSDASKAGHLHHGLEIGDAEMLVFGVIQSLVLRLMVTRNPTLLEQDGERLFDLQLALMKTEGNPL